MRYEIGNTCFELLIQGCFVNRSNLYGPYIDYFQWLNNERRDKTFPTFVKRTDEKEQTIKVSSTILDDYLPRFINKLQQCQVLDLGLGEGDLSAKVATYMQGQCNSVRYEGIDRSEKFVANATSNLLTVGIKDQNIIVGNCFGGDIDQLVTHPTLLIASQVVFYAPDIGEFIDKIIKKMGAVALIIGQSDSSFLNELNKKNAPTYKQKDTESKVKAILQTKDEVNHINILYGSIISFPDPKLTEKVAYAEFDSLTTQSERESREILEFIAGAPLEYLEFSGKLPQFIKDVTKHLERIGGSINFWNFMSIAMPEDNTTEDELKVSWLKLQKQKFSRDLTPFENALTEGNTKVVKNLFESGLILSALRSSKHLIEKLVGNVLSAINIFKFFTKGRFSVDDHFLNQALAVKEPGLPRLILEKLIEESEYIKQPKHSSYIAVSQDQAIAFLEEEITAKDHEYQFLGYGIIKSLVYSFSSMWILLVNKGLTSKVLSYIIGNVGMNSYICYKYYNTGISTLHSAVNSKSIQLTKHILKIEAAQKGIDNQTNEGQTALHLSVKLNQTDIVLELLNYKPNIFIPDYLGKLPIHYAVENNNYIIFDRLLEKGNDINSIIYNAEKNFFEGLLVIGMFYNMNIYFQNFDSEINGIKNIIESFNSYVLTGLLNIPFTISTSIFPTYTLDQSHYLKIRIAHSLSHHEIVDDIKLPHPILIASRFILNPLSILSYFSERPKDDSFLGYSYDSLLHVAARGKDAAFIPYILNKGGNLDLKNINEETPLHIAASYANYEAVVELTNHGADPNVLAHTSQSIFIKFFNYKLIALSLSGPISQILARAAFTKILHQDGFFNYSQEKNLGTPLIRALVGNRTQEILESKYIDKKPYILEELDTRSRIAEYLIDNGADPDHIFNFNLHSENFYINIASHISIYRTLTFIPIIQKNYLLCFIASKIFMDYLGRFIPFKSVSIKSIDFFDKEVKTDLEKSIYDYLKQYTTLNSYTDTEQMSFFSFKYLGYLLGIDTAKDDIRMNEYGIYKGGSGQDTFIVNPNFKGKEQGWKLIIKDYNSNEDVIDLTMLCNQVSRAEDIHYETRIVMNKSSTVIFTPNSEEIVTLYNFSIEEASNIQYRFCEEGVVMRDHTIKHEEL